MAKREDILDNIVTVLGAIAKEDDYNYNCGLATREVTDWMRLQSRQMPAAIVQWTEDEREARDLQGKNLLSTLLVTIRGVVESRSNVDEVMNKWAEFDQCTFEQKLLNNLRQYYALYYLNDLHREYIKLCHCFHIELETNQEMEYPILYKFGLLFFEVFDYHLTNSQLTHYQEMFSATNLHNYLDRSEAVME